MHNCYAAGWVILEELGSCWIIVEELIIAHVWKTLAGKTKQTETLSQLLLKSVFNIEFAELKHKITHHKH